MTDEYVSIAIDRYEQLIEKEFVCDRFFEMLRAAVGKDSLYLGKTEVELLAKAFGVIR